MNCTSCGSEIRQGEPHIALLRNVEVLGRKSWLERFLDWRHRFIAVITVKDSESLATYHERCEPSGPVVLQKADRTL